MNLIDFGGERSLAKLRCTGMLQFALLMFMLYFAQKIKKIVGT